MVSLTMIQTLADASSAANVMRGFVDPVVSSLCAAAGLVCAFFLISGGYHYMTSSGNPENLEHAKRVIRNALIGLITVLAAAVLTAILTHAYSGSAQAINSQLPNLTPLKPAPVSNGLVDVLIKAVTGFLNNIIQSIAEPFLKALTYFTSGTPLMANNASVFNFWLVIVGMSDIVFMLVVALLGFQVMGSATFGFDEVEFKHLLPRLGLIFLLINCSIFVIDGVIELSNAMIHAVNATEPVSSVWNVLTTVVKQAGGQGVAALLIMAAFLILAVVLLIYYVGRLVTLFIGAVLSPLILLLWLIPGFRDFSETAAKVYLTTIFVLFVHVVILQLAASLLAGMVIGSPTQTPDILMAMVVGLATLIALLKTQGLMMQLSYVSLGTRTARKLGSQFITGVSYMSGKTKKVAETVDGYRGKRGQGGSKQGGDDGGGGGFGRGRQPAYAFATYNQPGRRSGRDAYDASSEPVSAGSASRAKSRSKLPETSRADTLPKSTKAKLKEKKT